MEIIKILFLFIIATEIALILLKPDKKEEEEEERATRREVYGIYKNPLGDSYRKNRKNQYVPIKPGSKMIEGIGDDEE